MESSTFTFILATVQTKLENICITVNGIKSKLSGIGNTLFQALELKKN